MQDFQSWVALLCLLDYKQNKAFHKPATQHFASNFQEILKQSALAQL